MGCGSCNSCYRACCKKYYPSICECSGSFSLSVSLTYFQENGTTAITGSGNLYDLPLTDPPVSYVIKYTITNTGTCPLYSTNLTLTDNIFFPPANTTQTFLPNTPVVITYSTSVVSAVRAITAHSVVANVFVDTKCKKSKKCGKTKKKSYERWLTASYSDNIESTDET